MFPLNGRAGGCVIPLPVSCIPRRIRDGWDDIYNWPFMYAVEAGHWHLFDDEADQLREYLDRGGFLMTDDFHGTIEWENFMKSLQKVIGARPVEALANSDEIFHVIFELNNRPQIPGQQFLS